MMKRNHLPSTAAFLFTVIAALPSVNAESFVFSGNGVKRVYAPIGGVQARALSQGDEAELVLYEVGKPREDAYKRILTSQISLQYEGVGVPQFPVSGMVDLKEIAHLPGWYVATFSSARKAYQAIDIIRNTEGVKQAELLVKRKLNKKSVPTDPLYAYNVANAGYQWHLKNTGQFGGAVGVDLNVESVWNSYTGSGVKIGIVDDGLDTGHPDLNIDTTISHNWNSGTATDPSPTGGDRHGTSAAGVAAAKANNDAGGVGVAYGAELVGLRLTAEVTSDLQESEALAWENDEISIYSNSWGPSDQVVSYDGPGPMVEAALAAGVSSGRGGKGSIYVWAGGNGQRVYWAADDAYQSDNSNYDGYANRMETIAVGAVDDEGKTASEVGANIVVVAPSSGGAGSQSITTTDLVSNGGYRYDFGGTSAAVPQVAGVVALMLEANPNLGWRDVQEILMATARRVGASDDDWKFNGGGFAFNHKYGAGLVDAAAAVSLAQGWTNLGARTSHEVSGTSLPAAIPDFSVSGLTKSFDFSGQSNLRVEHVEVEVDTTHTYVGDLEITLISPSGTRSVLSEYHFNIADDLSWTFMSVHHWGEDSSGVWKVEVRDLGPGDTGTLDSIKVRLHGVEQAQGGVAPRLAGESVLKMVVGKPFFYQLSSPDQITSYTGSNLPEGVFLDHDGLLYGVPVAAGSGTASVSLTNGQGTATGGIYYTVIADGLASVADAIGWSNKALGTSGSLAWSVDDAVSSEDDDSAVTGGLQDYESASLAAHIVGPGTLEFDWKVSSELNGDFLEFLVDGVVVQRITGVVDWSQQTYAVPAGSHKVEWRYRKDYSGAGNLDRAWLDKVSYVQSGSYEEWATSEFSALELADELVSGDGADPDGDGIVNLMEFFRGSDPHVSNQATPLQFATSAGVMELRYDLPSGLSGIVHGIEWSENLQDWSFMGSDFDEESGGLEKRILLLPQDQQKRFYRLKLFR